MKILNTIGIIAILGTPVGAMAQTPEPKTPPASQAAPAQPQTPSTGVQEKGKMAAWGDARGWSVEKLLDTDVRTPEGDQVGEVEDVLFDDTGKIAYVVIAAGGFLGVGERNVAVPLESLQLARDSEGDVRFKMNIAKQDLETAPEYKGAD